MSRPRNQTKRRSELLESALDAIRERGVGSLRIRDIAEAAGVSTGTVHYYFDDIDRLLYELHRMASERFFDDRMSALIDIEDARAKLSTMIGSGLPSSPDDAMVVALYEIDIYKRGDPVHELLGRALFDRQVALYLGVLEVGQNQGHFRLQEPILDVAQNLVALEDAYGMHIVMGNRLSPSRCAELIVGYARAVTGCADLSLPSDHHPPRDSRPATAQRPRPARSRAQPGTGTRRAPRSPTDGSTAPT